MSTDPLAVELDALVAIDTERAALDARLGELAAQRQRQLGRMEVIAEQSGVDLAEYVGAAITARQSQP